MDIPYLLARAPRGVSIGGCVWAQVRMDIYHKFGWSFVRKGAQRPNNSRAGLLSCRLPTPENNRLLYRLLLMIRLFMRRYTRSSDFPQSINSCLLFV